MKGNYLSSQLLKSERSVLHYSLAMMSQSTQTELSQKLAGQALAPWSNVSRTKGLSLASLLLSET